MSNQNGQGRVLSALDPDLNTTTYQGGRNVCEQF
jgi:hypothetical protein